MQVDRQGRPLLPAQPQIPRSPQQPPEQSRWPMLHPLKEKLQTFFGDESVTPVSIQEHSTAGQPVLQVRFEPFHCQRQLDQKSCFNAVGWLCKRQWRCHMQSHRALLEPPCQTHKCPISDCSPFNRFLDAKSVFEQAQPPETLHEVNRS